MSQTVPLEPAAPAPARVPEAERPEPKGEFYSSVELLFLTRYPILLGLALPGIVPLALYVNPELLRNFLVLDWPVHVFNVAWMSYLVAALVIVSWRVVELNANARFAIGPYTWLHPRGRWGLRWLYWLVIGSVVPVACVVETTLDPWREGWDRWGWPVWQLGSVMVALGLIVALLILFLLTALQQLLLDPAVTADHLLPFESLGVFARLRAVRFDLLHWLGDKLARWLDRLGPGYSRTVRGVEGRKVLATGHAQATLWFAVALIAYVGSYRLTFLSRVPDAYSIFPALFYLLLIMLLAGTFLSGLAFLLDYYRFPTILVVLLLSLASYGLFRVDHFYEIVPSPAAATPAPAPVEVTAAIANKTFATVTPQTGERAGKPTRTMVVVTAAGGGIQAAAWTAEVLAKLDERYGEDFSRSVALISSVSGGSVGTMFYATSGSWNKPGPPFDADARELLLKASRSSCLEATGWGLAYPDLMRLVFPPAVDQGLVDRGWAIERAWGRWPSRLTKATVDDERLRDWSGLMASGDMPLIAFNSTVVETGQRLVISPALGPGEGSKPTQPEQFLQLYSDPSVNPRVTTVARLSATFPYVSPISRPFRLDPVADQGKEYHLADGGYADNEGMTTVISWLNQVLTTYAAKNRKDWNFDRILVVRIVPFPVSDLAQARTDKGWLYAFLGPIETMENVRTASQAERNSSLLELMSSVADVRTDLADQHGIRRRRDAANARANQAHAQGVISQHRTTARAGDKDREEEDRERKDAAALSLQLQAQAEITWTAFVYPVADAPLSWKLTQKYQDGIDTGWSLLCAKNGKYPPNGLNEPPLKTVDRFFPPKKQPAEPGS
jgi:hypothetical protein